MIMVSRRITGRTVLGVALALTVALAATLFARDEAPGPERQQARQILDATGVEGGLVVHLGCGDGRLTAALGPGDRFLIHGLDADPDNVERARQHVRSLGRYGKIAVDRHTGSRLPYADNLVNLLIAERLGRVPMDEVMRVLCPGGLAYVRQGDAWAKTVKPRPPQLDEWTHSLHAADNNAVGQDAVVGPPRHIQWVGEPRRARQHENLASVSAVVSAGGRIFSIEDRGPIASIMLPAKWFLVGRDAFNGVTLWKRPVGPWEGHLRPFRMGPPDISRRLVAVGDRVYVTLGYGKPLSALRGATGETVTDYEGTEGTTEVLCRDGVLYVVVGDVDAQQAAEAAKRRGASPSPRDKRILAIRADTGEPLWTKSDLDTSQLLPATLAVSSGRVFFQNPEKIFCLSASTGEKLWQAARPVAAKRPDFSAPTLVVYDDVVLSADRATPADVQREPERVHKTSWVDAPAGELIAFSAETGERLWSARCREGFNAPVDVLVADGLVWTGEIVLAADPGITAGRDPQTGEIKRRRPADQAFFQVGMPHHRCHRNRATEQYLVLGRAGVEFIDLASGKAWPNHWIRGTCQFGTLPCNGLLYVPPHSCACYTKAKLNGFYALAAKRASKPPQKSHEDDNRLQRGPAFAQAIHPPSFIIHPSANWPTYRHDAPRSGSTKTPVPAELETRWETKLGGPPDHAARPTDHPSGGARRCPLSSLTIAEGKVFVAVVDEHTVHAVDSRDGNLLWHYTAGGRVDSPPTIAQGLAVFGSADGWVYCLRAADGSLVWRFRAAPEDRRVVAYEQLESTWPVHGSVLVEDEVVYVAAGRSSYLDGGICLFRLDLKTGKMLSETRIDSRDPESGRQPKGAVEMFDLPGALPEILSSDGTFIYMRHMKFDRQGARQADDTPHLFCPTGLLDDTGWHRSYWILGTRFYTGYRDWFRAGREVPAGRPLVFDESRVYGFAYKPDYYYWSTPLEYHVFAAAREPEIVESPKKRPRVPAWGQQQIAYDWSQELPVQIRAMVLAGETLFVAGPPDLVDEQQAYRHRDDAGFLAKLAEQADALEGRKGAMLRAVSASDGKRLAEYSLSSPPTWDGMATAGGCLYLSTMDGNVLCLAGK
jgi:outer membrane protein assembly factor BamB